MNSWNQTVLDAAVRERVKLLGRTPAQVVNTAAYWIAVNTKNDVPFADPGRINTDLAVATNPVILKSGAVGKRKKTTFGAGRGNAPLAALIIQARANPNYRGPWKGPSPFKGVSREEGARRMRQAMFRLLRARRSSSKFFRVGWVQAIRALKPFSVNRFRADSGSAFDRSERYFQFTELGRGTPAQEGFTAFATIENLIGTHPSPLSDSQNAALHRLTIPSLERAMYREAALMNEYTMKALEADNQVFNRRAA